MMCRSQWLRCLKRRSTAARLLRSWVRIPPEAWMSVVSVVCCQIEVSATDWSLVQRSPTNCGASLCVIKKPRTRVGYSPARGLQNTNPQWVVAPGGGGIKWRMMCSTQTLCINFTGHISFCYISWFILFSSLNMKIFWNLIQFQS